MEFGVFEGDSINFISSALPDKIIYGFDSFEGLPEVWRESFDRERFDRKGVLPQVNANVRLVKGWFNETLPEFVKTHPEQCAFIHINCDLYSSTKTVLNTLKNQIGAGTVNDFVASNHIEFEYVARSNQGQVSVRIK